MSSVAAFHPHPRIFVSNNEYRAICKCGWEGPVRVAVVEEEETLRASQWCAYIDAKEHFREKIKEGPFGPLL